HPTTAADTPSPPNTSALPTTAPPTIARDGSLAPTSGPNPPGLQSAAPPPTYPAGWQSELSRRRMDAGTIDWVQERGHAWDVVKATLTRFDAASRAGRIENPPGWMRTVLPEVAASHRPAAATPNPPPRPPIDVQAVIDRDRAIRREAISRDREWEEAQKAIVPRPFPFSTAPPPRRQVTLLPRPLAPPADAAIDQAFEQKRRQAVASLDSLPPPPTASPSSGPQPPLPGSEHSTTVKEEPHAPAA
ncbi:MAG TPA: hypothetical protein VG672_19715, partial [Bryobacteraceae bacterium]|nr:hypothetical protein [Bryobacteraceae bacterium]